MEKCRSEEVALKSLFLGPQAENHEWVSTQIDTLLKSWFDWRRSFRPEDGRAISEDDMKTPEYLLVKARTEKVLKELASRFEQEIPKFSPRYIGHMFSEMSLPALFGHILTLLHNPNNISGESSKVGVLIEEEAVGALAKMIGFQNGIGHFTSGGTIANFEAVYRARTRCFNWMAVGRECGSPSAFESAAMGWVRYEWLRDFVQQTEDFHLCRSPVLLVPQHKHYSWVKAVNVFGLGADSLWSVQVSSKGHLDVQDLEKQILRAHTEDRPVMMVVSVLGTTELGMIDPIHEVQALLNRYQEERGWHLWHHVDAAYGGFLCSLIGDDPQVAEALSEESLKAIRAVGLATSVTIDPHKLGYVPYASGVFLADDSKDYYQQSFGGPYVDFSVQRDKGPFTLEGSRPATGAVATWMTSQCVGLSQEGYGQIIARTIRLRKELERRLTEETKEVRLAPFVDSNLLGFNLARVGDSLKKVNERTLRLYESLGCDEKSDFYLSKTVLYLKNYSSYFEEFVKTWQGELDADELVLIRICIMNPFFKSVEMDVDLQELFVKLVAKSSRELE
ncbi:aspartate aminotransferase family protein [Bdellovibrio bacteriovorus]|uniref:pyridoxal phosphate-dependent decarboxylase family protein n=1 Tax=Bdellovibrio bacteriovorus TaxID=959 RepID=UPI0035A99200